MVHLLLHTKVVHQCNNAHNEVRLRNRNICPFQDSIISLLNHDRTLEKGHHESNEHQSSEKKKKTPTDLFLIRVLFCLNFRFLYHSPPPSYQ